MHLKHKHELKDGQETKCESSMKIKNKENIRIRVENKKQARALTTCNNNRIEKK